MRNFVLILFSLFAFLSASAQDNQEKVFEEKGEQLLKQAADKLASFESLEIDFTYEMKNEAHDITEEMEGSLISQGDKYRMQVGENIFISDGETMWSYMGEFDEVHVNLVENTEGAITPTSIIEGFEKEFRSKFIRQEPYKDGTINIIDLIPSEPQAFFKYRLAIDSSTNMVVYTVAYDRQGSTYSYHIDDFEVNPSVSEDLFTFDPEKHPDAEIIDLR